MKRRRQRDPATGAVPALPAPSPPAATHRHPRQPPRLGHAFFRRDPRTCAADLIGCELRWDGCVGIVVETEAYSVADDEACHTFARPGARAFVADHPAGTAYVYLNYGMYWLLNVLVKGGAEDGFVLIRALEPTCGLAAMRVRRKTADPLALCSGPGKLTRAMAITGADHGIDLCARPGRSFRGRRRPVAITTDVRIGISRATALPWRYLLRGSRFVSVGIKATASPARPGVPA